jgi:abequosyltransferase
VTDKIKLSICIATFNRGTFITETLNSIAPQLHGGVELVVVDGASTDDTSERVTEFRSRHPFVRYIRETRNSGVDQDFDKAVAYADGEYVWLMTDDDLMLPGAVSRVCAALAQKHELIVMNSQVRTADLSKLLNERLIELPADRDYTSAAREQFFVDIARGLTFIGSVVIRRDVWLARERRAYYGSLFIHVGVIFQSPPLGRVRFVADPVLQVRYGLGMWTPRSFEVWMYKWPGLIWSFDAYTDATKAQITRREPWRSPMKLFHFRSKYGYSIAEYRKFFAHVDGWYRTCAFAIALFPAALANVLSIAYVAVRGTQNRIPLYDLVNAQRWPFLRRALLKLFGL